MSANSRGERNGGFPAADTAGKQSGRLGSRPSTGNGGFPAADSEGKNNGTSENRPSTRLIDLTLTLRPGMRGVAFQPKFNFKQHGWHAQTLHLYSHCGTHMDAPAHCQAGDQTIDEVPLTQCMGPAWLIKLDGIAPKALITVADLGDIAQRLAPGDCLLLRTGWSAFADQSKWRDELPRVSLELARWCVEQRVKLLGVEPPSVADVNNLPEVIQIHQTLLGGGVLIVEGLTNLEAITQEKFFFAALPLKPLRGDGSPVRAFAVEGGNGGIPAAQDHSAGRSAGGKDAALPDPLGSLVFLQHERIESHANRLPHWHQDEATYFVTFRLADALPEDLLGQWQAECEAWMRVHPLPWTDEQAAEYQKRFPARIERWLDEGHGTCVLRNSECRQVVSSALRHFHRERYDLLSFAIMPNHVHVLFSLRDAHRLEEVLHSWKSFSATEINRRLGRQGALWMKDYFDRSIRDREHFIKVARYIRSNPEKAKLPAGKFALWEGDLVADVLDRKGGWSGGNGGILAAQHPSAGRLEGGRDAALPEQQNGGKDAAAPA